jgi:hypothetical protein
MTAHSTRLGRPNTTVYGLLLYGIERRRHGRLKIPGTRFLTSKIDLFAISQPPYHPHTSMTAHSTRLGRPNTTVYGLLLYGIERRRHSRLKIPGTRFLTHFFLSLVISRHPHHAQTPSTAHSTRRGRPHTTVYRM